MDMHLPTRRDCVAAAAGAALLVGILIATGATPTQPPRTSGPGPDAVVPFATSDKQGARGIIIDTRDGRCWIIIGAVVRPLLYDDAAAQILPRLRGLDDRCAPVDITDQERGR